MSNPQAGVYGDHTSDLSVRTSQRVSTTPHAQENTGIKFQRPSSGTVQAPQRMDGYDHVIPNTLHGASNAGAAIVDQTSLSHVPALDLSVIPISTVHCHHGNLATRKPAMLKRLDRGTSADKEISLATASFSMLRVDRSLRSSNAYRQARRSQSLVPSWTKIQAGCITTTRPADTSSQMTP